MTDAKNIYTEKFRINNFWEYCFDKGKQNVNDLIKRCSLFFTSQEYKVIRTIDDLDKHNLRIFLIAVLKMYQQKAIKYWEILNLADTLEIYFIKKEKFLDNIIINLRKEERLGFYLLNYILGKFSPDFIISPKNTPHFINFLQTPYGQEDQAIYLIEDYITNMVKLEKEDIYH